MLTVNCYLLYSSKFSATVAFFFFADRFLFLELEKEIP